MCTMFDRYRHRFIDLHYCYSNFPANIKQRQVCGHWQSKTLQQVMSSTAIPHLCLYLLPAAHPLSLSLMASMVLGASVIVVPDIELERSMAAEIDLVCEILGCHPITSDQATKDALLSTIEGATCLHIGQCPPPA